MQLISVLIVLSGLLIPVLAAAPFYVLDSRAERRAAEQEAAQCRSARTETSEVGATVNDASATEPAAATADGAGPVAVAGPAAESAAEEAPTAQETAEPEAFEDTIVHELQFPTQPSSDSIEDENPVQGSEARNATVQCDAA